jgi:hypothetical protein
LTDPSSGNAGIGGINAFNTASGDSVLAFSTRGSATLAERARIDSSGNLGLGVTPNAQLASYKSFQFGIGGNLIGRSDNAGIELSSNSYRNASGVYTYLNTDSAASYRQYSGQHEWFSAPSGTAGNAISFTQAMTLDASGRLGIGQTSPQFPLHITGVSGVNTYAHFTNATTGNTASDGLSIGVANGASDAYIIQRESANLFFYTNALERAAIDASGNLLVGTTSNSRAARLRVEGMETAQLTGYGNGYGIGIWMTPNPSATGGTATPMSFQNVSDATVGTITTTASATAYNTSSDYRLKNTIAPMTGALAKVALLKPCTYKWNADGSDGEGFIAHELAEVVPQCVTGEKDAVDAEGKPQYQGIDTSFLVATLTAAIQELKAEFDAYKASHP